MFIWMVVWLVEDMLEEIMSVHAVEAKAREALTVMPMLVDGHYEVQEIELNDWSDVWEVKSDAAG